MYDSLTSKKGTVNLQIFLGGRSLCRRNSRYSVIIPSLCTLPSQPKGFKEFWFVFRALESGDKLLEYYQNERKYHDKGPSKGWIPLREANFVQHHDLEKKHLFCIEFREQSVAFFEAMSTDESEDWMQCLNAVLFGKGPRGGKGRCMSSHLEWKCPPVGV